MKMKDTYTTYKCSICGKEYTIRNANLDFDCETCCGIKMLYETLDNDDDAVNKYYTS